jgi:hypothetical protein
VLVPLHEAFAQLPYLSPHPGKSGVCNSEALSRIAERLVNAKLHVQRSIVRQRVGDVKTVYSGKTMCIDGERYVNRRLDKGCGA